MIILASASAARQAMLDRAGVAFACQPSTVDEAAVKAALKADNLPVAEVAVALAEIKAQQVAMRQEPTIVLGSDQMLVCEGRWFDKPADIREAREQLQFLRGKTHRLYSAAVLMRGTQRLWHHVAHADLTMWDFPDGFLEAYLARMGDSVTSTVGCYRLEDGGAPLFSRVSGDPFVIQGLPLLAVCHALRELGEG